MRKFINKYMLGCALLTSGLLVTDTQALVGPGQIDSQSGGYGSGRIILVHGSHSNCQQGNNGRWHKHGFKTNKKKSCTPPKHSPVPLELPDGSLINHSSLQSSEKVQQQSH